MSATAAPPAGGTACPRCGAPVGDDQDWCLNCGDAARTRLAPTPNWRLPIALTAIVAALALLVIAASFVALTRDDAPVQQTTSAPPPTTAPPPATTTAPPASTVPPATTTPPATTAPGATTPGATTPGVTTPGTTTPTTPTAPGGITTTP